MELGIKERQRYRDISWLMSSVDVESIMNILGTKIHGWSGDRVIGFCPDHVHYVGRKPSDPNWLLNTKTGETFCLTEGRGSNLVWTLCRVLSCPPVDAVKIITGVDAESLTQMRISANVIRGKMRGMREVPEKEEAPKAVVGLDDISKDLITRPTSSRMYDFFMTPPGKKHPTNILKSTVDRYGVFERTWGYYADRAIIPFFLKTELKGFAAVDLLGKEAWMEKHSLSDKYKKTLTAINFQVGEYLFGFDDCQKGCDYLIVVEGPREVMKLWQEGFTNVVATLGIHLGPKQLVMLASLAPKRVLLMYDNDLKGVEAMEKMEKALSRLFVVRKCLVPPGMDPKNLSGDELKKVAESGCKD
jgi:5S rRNA maturation endonuclease (ribonuclease M5)